LISVENRCVARVEKQKMADSVKKNNSNSIMEGYSVVFDGEDQFIVQQTETLSLILDIYDTRILIFWPVSRSSLSKMTKFYSETLFSSKT
jgi:hypothetical protein